MDLSPGKAIEPVWRNRVSLPRSSVPSDMRTWLFNDTSLTARLVADCKGTFRVEVLRQRYARAQRNEERLLDMRHRQYALLREVYLYCGDMRVVYARSGSKATGRVPVFLSQHGAGSGPARRNISG